MSFFYFSRLKLKSGNLVMRVYRVALLQKPSYTQVAIEARVQTGAPMQKITLQLAIGVVAGAPTSIATNKNDQNTSFIVVGMNLSRTSIPIACASIIIALK